MTDNEKYGVPEGYEFVRLGVPEVGEECISLLDGIPEECTVVDLKPYQVRVIVKPSEPDAAAVAYAAAAAADADAADVADADAYVADADAAAARIESLAQSADIVRKHFPRIPEESK